MPSLLLDIGSVMSETGSSLAHSEEVHAAGFSVGPHRFAFESPVAVDVSLSNTGALVLLEGTARAIARTHCARCLEPFQTELRAEVEGYLVAPGSDEELPDDVDAIVVDGDTLDLWPIVESSLAETAPFAPIHDPDCAGICALCGANRNAESCTCATETPESPFAVLKDMFPDSDPADSE